MSYVTIDNNIMTDLIWNYAYTILSLDNFQFEPCNNWLKMYYIAVTSNDATGRLIKTVGI